MARDNRDGRTVAEMTEPTISSSAFLPQLHVGLRVMLIVVAIIEAFDGLWSFPTLFGDMSQIPGPGLGGLLIKAHIAMHLPLSLAALAFAISLTLRTVDIALCPAFPLGTHFAWHILNAVVLYVLLRTAMSARPSHAGRGP